MIKKQLGLLAGSVMVAATSNMSVQCAANVAPPRAAKPNKIAAIDALW